MTENERREVEIRSIMNALTPKAEAKEEEKPAKKQTKKAK